MLRGVERPGRVPIPHRPAKLTAQVVILGSPERSVGNELAHSEGHAPDDPGWRVMSTLRALGSVTAT